MAVWDDVLPEEDRLVFEAAGASPVFDDDLAAQHRQGRPLSEVAASYDRDAGDQACRAHEDVEAAHRFEPAADVRDDARGRPHRHRPAGERARLCPCRDGRAEGFVEAVVDLTVHAVEDHLQFVEVFPGET